MPASDTLLSLVQDPTVRMVAGGAGLLGAVAGLAGSFAVLRRQSLQGDVVSHAALPGVAGAMLIFGGSPGWLLVGGAVAGWLALIAVSLVVKRTKTSPDSGLAISLATFFGFGLVLKSFAQRANAGSEQIGLDQYLFGQAATMRSGDVMAMSIVGIVIASIILFCWHRFKVVSFDPAFAETIGIKEQFWSGLLTTAVVAAAVVGLQAVGVVLMSALLVAPAIAARFWSNRLSVVVTLAAVLGGISGVLGTVLTVSKSNVPTGPVIVLTATGLVFFSMAVRWCRNQLYFPARNPSPNRNNAASPASTITSVS